MRIIYTFPPNIDLIRAAFPHDRLGDAIFAYGKAVYSPRRAPIHYYILAHERVHLRRQGADCDGWWEKYIKDLEFRLNEEAKAHKMEFVSFCEREKDRAKRQRYFDAIAGRLAGPLYGNIVNLEKAKELIR